MIDMLMKALEARDEELEAAADQKQGELDVIRTERTSIAGQLRLLEKLDLDILAPYLAPPVLVLPELSAVQRAEMEDIIAKAPPGHLMLPSESPPVAFQRIKPEDVTSLHSTGPHLEEVDEEDRVEAEEPFVAEPSSEAEGAPPPAPALSDKRTSEIVKEAHAAIARSTGAQGIRPALIAYLDKAINPSGSLLVDEKMIAKKVGHPFVSVKKALLILEKEGKLGLKAAPKGMIAIQADRKALAAEIL